MPNPTSQNHSRQLAGYQAQLAELSRVIGQLQKDRQDLMARDEANKKQVAAQLRRAEAEYYDSLEKGRSFLQHILQRVTDAGKLTTLQEELKQTPEHPSENQS